MSPTLRSFHPLAELTRRVGSYSLVHFASRAVSYWPQPSLKTTQQTIDGWLCRASIIALSSRSNCADDDLERSRSGLPGGIERSPEGMSCHTISPSLSHQ